MNNEKSSTSLTVSALPTVIDDGVSKRVTLRKGPNLVRAAVVNGEGATDFCARFLDAEDKPVKDLTVNLSEVRP